MKIVKGWKTRIAAVSMALTGVVAAVDPALLVSLLGQEYETKILLGYAVVFAILREITNTPAGKQ